MICQNLILADWRKLPRNAVDLEDFAANKYTKILSGWQSRQIIHIDEVSENDSIFKTD